MSLIQTKNGIRISDCPLLYLAIKWLIVGVEIQHFDQCHCLILFFKASIRINASTERNLIFNLLTLLLRSSVEKRCVNYTLAVPMLFLEHTANWYILLAAHAPRLAEI